ncbi:LEE-encoded protein [Citrobacter freundii]|nr:LEE-encoded protein [Citrobacter freundii]
MSRLLSGKIIVFFIGSLLISSPVLSQDCFDRAGRHYRIDPDLLRAIAFRESSWRGKAMNMVSSKEYAVGMMQIHSQNFSHLVKFGITPQKLYHNSCLNIYTGAYYLSIAFRRWGYSWQAVGAYNAGFRLTEKQDLKRRQYASGVQNTYRKLKKRSH